MRVWSLTLLLFILPFPLILLNLSVFLIYFGHFSSYIHCVLFLCYPQCPCCFVFHPILSYFCDILYLLIISWVLAMCYLISSCFLIVFKFLCFHFGTFFFHKSSLFFHICFFLRWNSHKFHLFFFFFYFVRHPPT